MSDHRYTNGRDDIDWEDIPYTHEELERERHEEWEHSQFMQGYEDDY